jgi:hypothetical protein
MLYSLETAFDYCQIAVVVVLLQEEGFFLEEIMGEKGCSMCVSEDDGEAMGFLPL